MSEWAPKRFYKDASVEAEGDGFAVRLDDRPIRTPSKQRFILPTAQMAEAVAAEWCAQDKVIDPTTMPWTRSANSAIDKVSAQRTEIMDHLAEYGETDLLYYRAERPLELIARQAEAWDPILDWAARRFDLSFRTTSGVMPVAQSDAVAGRLRHTMEPMSDFQLTGFHDLVALSGSLLLALAAVERPDDATALWQASRIDEDWQAEQWGIDEEAAEVAARKRRDFLHAMEFYRFA